jgi:hypothetical protein
MLLIIILVLVSCQFFYQNKDDRARMRIRAISSTALFAYPLLGTGAAYDQKEYGSLRGRGTRFRSAEGQLVALLLRSRFSLSRECRSS